MMSDANRLGLMAARLMQEVSDRYGDEAEIRTMGIAVEIDGKESTTFMWAFSDDRPWVQSAFVDQVAALVDKYTEEE